MVDICKVIGVNRDHGTVKRVLNEPWEGMAIFATPSETTSGVQNLVFVNEYVINEILCRVKKPVCKQFRKFLFDSAK